MKRSAWAVAGLVLLIIGLIVGYATAPAEERAGNRAPGTARDAH